MPEAVIVSTARTPDRPRLQGLAQGRPPRRPGRRGHQRRAGQGPGARPGRLVDDLYLGLRRAVGRARHQHGPRRRRAGRAGPPARRHGQPVLLLVACRPPGWPSTRSRPARATSSSRPASSASRRYIDFAGAGGVHGRLAEPAVRRGRRPAARGTRRDNDDLDRPARGRPAARRLPRDGPDRRERRHACAASPASARTSGASRARTAPRRPSPTASSPARSPRSPRRTAPSSAPTTARAPGVTLEGVSGPEAGVPRGGHGHRRQLLPAQRRRRRARRHERHQGRASSA